MNGAVSGWLLPAPDEASVPFFEWCARGELRIQRCSACDLRRMPPRPMCPACGSFDSEWQQMSGRGRVWSVAIPHPPLLSAYAEQAPYNVVIVELDEGPRMHGRLVPETDLSAVSVGLPVEVTYQKINDQITLPMFKAATGT